MVVETNLGSGGREFPSTRWTVVLAARRGPDAARAALEALLGAYWRPLYFLARRKGLQVESAKDAVQGFCAQLVAKEGFLERLDPARGRFRGYLRTAFENHLRNLHESASAAKRGGGARVVSLDEDVERDLAGAAEDPGRAFDREWATGVFGRALAALEREFEDGVRRGSFEVVRRFFALEGSPPYAEAAAACGMSVPRFKAFLHRARARFRELVRAEIAETTDEVDAELEELLRALA